MLYAEFEERTIAEAALASAAVQTDQANSSSIDRVALQAWQDDDNFLRLMTASGNIVLDSSATFGEIEFDKIAVDAAISGEPWYAVDGSGSEPLGIVTTPVYDGENVWGVLQLGKSRADLDEVLRAILIALAIATPIIIAVASAGGYFLAGRALRPVDEVTRLAAEIEADDLGARLDLDLPNDEIGTLATTFNSMLDRVEDAFERQSRFTGDAAHELRTPLALMQSEVDLALAGQRSDAEYRATLVHVDGDLERLSGIVRGLLMLARADADAIVLERESFQLQETLHAVLEQYRVLANETGVELKDESADITVQADEDLIIQLLVNLVDNAMAHTSRGDWIEVGSRDTAVGTELWVADSGEGIAPEDIDQVTEQFYRVDAGRSRSDGGVGLGLAICQAIVDAHGGSLDITSSPGAGTRVDIVLPSN